MKANASRIRIIDFEGVPSYTRDGLLAASRRQSGASRVSDVSAASCFERFDVRRARCAQRDDEDALRGAIESGCVAGVETFNSWMHELLTSSGSAPRTASPPPTATPTGAKLRNSLMSM